MRKFGLYSLCTVGLLAFIPSAGAQFDENWDGGIDPSKWTLVGDVQLTDLGGGDMAISTWSGRDEVADWANYFYSVDPFPRQDEWQCKFKAWWSGADNSGAAINGPWHWDDISPPWQSGEAIFSGWYGNVGEADDMYASDRGWLSGPALTPEWREAWSKADSKADALTIRLILGYEYGAKFEWTTGVEEICWIPELDSRRDPTASDNEELWLKFGSWRGEVFIDDIIVFVPTPTPSYTPVPAPDTDIKAEVPFTENWNSNSDDDHIWWCPPFNLGRCGRRIDLGDGDYALSTETDITSLGFFERGDHLSCTFKAWWTSSNIAAAINGPWTYNRDLSPEAIIRGWYGLCDGIDWMRMDVGGEASGQDLSMAWREAWDAADSKARAITVRVTLGETSGAKYEWSTDGGLNWTLEGDFRGDPSARANPKVWLMFGSSLKQCLIDDIVVDVAEDSANVEPFWDTYD